MKEGPGAGKNAAKVLVGGEAATWTLPIRSSPRHPFLPISRFSPHSLPFLLPLSLYFVEMDVVFGRISSVDGVLILPNWGILFIILLRFMYYSQLISSYYVVFVILVFILFFIHLQVGINFNEIFSPRFQVLVTLICIFF